MTSAPQSALPFPFEPTYDPDAFFPSGCNAEARAWMERPTEWPALRLAVHGDPGTGKTHLLRYFAARHRAVVLAAGDLPRFTPPPTATALAIDDADSAADPEALLHVLNAASEAGVPVLMTGRTAPAYWPFTLPDLMSRLKAMPVVALLPPDDELLRAMLARLLADRQIVVPQRVQAFLLARLPRTGGTLRDAAARLDRYSLAEGRAVTHKLAQRVIDECSAPSDSQEKGPEEISPGPLPTTED